MSLAGPARSGPALAPAGPAPRRDVPRRSPRQEPPARPPLRVVPDPAARRRHRRRRAVIVAALVGVVAGLFGVVGLHVRLAEGQADLDELRGRLEAEVERNQGLRVDVARAESPEAVLAGAQRLGMVAPGAVRTLAPVPWPPGPEAAGPATPAGPGPGRAGP